VIPQDVPLSPLWILGSSEKGAKIAGKLGLGFAYANHFKSDMLFDALDLFRENFQPSIWLKSPRTIVGASVVCADTDSEAKVEIPSLDLAWLLRKTDRRSQIPSPEEGLRYPYSSQEREWIEEARRLHIVGNPVTVKAGIENLAARTLADEIIVDNDP
jgi:luciferase family oxidoreductase group 1